MKPVVIFILVLLCIGQNGIMHCGIIMATNVKTIPPSVAVTAIHLQGSNADVLMLVSQSRSYVIILIFITLASL